MDKALSNERIDEIGFSGYKVIQNPDWFCFGIDAVLLASFARVRAGARAVDLGTGTGIIPLIMKHKYDPSVVYGIEVQPQVAAMARRTMEMNGLEDRIPIINANVKEAVEILGTNRFDAVVTNPPYVGPEDGIKGMDPIKAVSRHEIEGTLEDFIACAFRLLKAKGDLYMVHRPSRLVDVVELCRRYRLEPKELQFIQPEEGKKPNIFLIHCIKFGNPELRFLDPIIVYDSDKNYTEQVAEIYERL